MDMICANAQRERLPRTNPASFDYCHLDTSSLLGVEDQRFGFQSLLVECVPLPVRGQIRGAIAIVKAIN